MKTKLILLAGIAFMFATSMQAQGKIKPRDLEGIWMMKLDLDEDDLLRLADQEDNAFVKAVMRGVSGFIDGIMDEIEIQFEFLPKNELRVLSYAFGEEDEEYSTWEIDSNGDLIIGETDKISSGEDTVWRLEDGILVAYNKKERDTLNGNLFLVKIK